MSLSATLDRPSQASIAAWPPILACFGRDELIRDAVVFPDPDATEISFRSPVSTALLRLVDGTIWLLGSADPWASHRLIATAQKLLQLSKQDHGYLCLRERVAGGGELGYLNVWDNISFEKTIARQWRIEEVLKSSGVWNSCAEQAIVRALKNHLARFCSEIDPEVGSIALRGSSLNVWIHNYLLSDPSASGWRRQFAQAFPLLVNPAVSPTALEHPEPFVIRLVDNGLPLIEGLARYWGVAPRVVRFLRGTTAAQIGSEWDGRIEGLAKLVDLMPTDKLPSGGDQWRRFNGLVSYAEDWSLGDGSVVHRILVAAILRELASFWLKPISSHNVGGSNLRSGPKNHLVAPRLVDRILLLRRTLIAIYEAELMETGPVLPETTNVVYSAADHVLEVLLRRGKLSDAVGYLAQVTAAGTPLGRLRDTLGSPSILPTDPWVSNDGKRVVRHLRTSEDLIRHGRFLANCLSDGGVHSRYLKGSVAVLAFSCKESGLPVSTASVSYFAAGATAYARTRSHTGFSNGPVGQDCANALDEIIGLLSQPEGRQCLEHARASRTQATRMLFSAGERDALRSLVSRSVGQTVFGDGLAQIRAAAQRDFE